MGIRAGSWFLLIVSSNDFFSAEVLQFHYNILFSPGLDTREGVKKAIDFDEVAQGLNKRIIIQQAVFQVARNYTVT